MLNFSRGRPWLVALLALVVLGALLRLPVADFCLPQLSHYDEFWCLKALQAMRDDPATAASTPYYNVYPHFMTWIGWLIVPTPVVPVPGDLAQHLVAASRDLWILRLIAAVLSLIAVPATWLVARRFVDRPTALLAAALVAVSLFHVWYSDQAKPHGAASGVAVLAVYAALLVRRRGDGLSYLLAGITAGVAIGCSQAAVSVLPALAVAHLLRNRAGSRWAWLWLAAAAALMGGCILKWGEPTLDGVLTIGRVAVYEEQHFGLLDTIGLVSLGLWQFDPLLFLLAVVGACAAPFAFWRAFRAAPRPEPAAGDWFLRRWLRGQEDLAVVLAHVLLYGLVLLINQHASHRYFVLLWPYAMCLAAWATMRASAGCARRWSPLAWALPLALVALETGFTLKLNAVQRAPDTSAQAAHWIERTLDPKTTRIAVLRGFDLPLLREPRVLADDNYERTMLSPWARYQARLGDMPRGATTWQIFSALPPADPAAELLPTPADYVVIRLDDRQVISAANERVRASGTRVARFSPMQVDEGDDTPLLWWDAYREYHEGFSRLWRTLHARSLGGVIEIYRIEKR
jgi:Dolichyl-phosphate-mannose-protein mannosyltransferase